MKIEERAKIVRHVIAGLVANSVANNNESWSGWTDAEVDKVLRSAFAAAIMAAHDEIAIANKAEIDGLRRERDALWRQLEAENTAYYLLRDERDALAARVAALEGAAKKAHAALLDRVPGSVPGGEAACEALRAALGEEPTP